MIMFCDVIVEGKFHTVPFVCIRWLILQKFMILKSSTPTIPHMCKSKKVLFKVT